jgi:hypothetical protein
MEPPHRRGDSRSEYRDSPRTAFEVYGCPVAVGGVLYFFPSSVVSSSTTAQSFEEA